VFKSGEENVSHSHWKFVFFLISFQNSHDYDTTT
jgi:hypothetical protein